MGENRQFHHEIRGSDGVTYGCFGYFDANDKLLMTYYVADAHGYRPIEANKPAKIFPVVTDTKYVRSIFLIALVNLLLYYSLECCRYQGCRMRIQSRQR